MSRTPKNSLLLVLLLTASLQILAQTDSTTSGQLDEVVVTATKFPVKQSQTGKVIIVINKATLEKNEGRTIGEILNEQAGVEVNGALNNLGTNQTIYMRGAGSGRTLILVDGIPVSDPSRIDNSFDPDLIPTDQIERIEICKGAQSTLYGSDAEAGVINIITIKPGITRPVNVKATLAGGNYGTYQTNLQIFGKLFKTLTYNLRYTHSSTDGFSAAYDSTGNHNFDKDGYRGDALTGNVNWKASSALSLQGFFQYSRYKIDADQSAFTDARNYTSANKNILFGGGFQYHLAGTTITGNYRYSATNRDLLEDSLYGQTYYNDRYYGKSLFGEIYANTNLGKGFTFLNGADFNSISMNEKGVSGTYPLAFTDTALTQTSMYSSLFYSGKSGLNAEVGGRLNTQSRYGSNLTFTFNPSFLVNRHFKIYASIASGFKTPSLFQLYDVFSGNVNLEAEKSLNFEGGMQYSNQVLNLRLTYFNRKIDNGIDFDYISYRYFNIDREKARGLEWENKIALGKKMTIIANYTLLLAREASQSRITTKDTTYSYALRRPENTCNISLGYKLSQNLYLDISAHYESKRFDIGGYDANFNPLPDALLKGFLIFNAYAEYKPHQKIKFFVEARNITGQKFFTIYGFNSIPFMLLGGITFNL